MNNFKNICFLLALACLASCATKKKRSDSDPGKVKMFYHNLTSKYNGYFNANELMKKNLVVLNDQHQPNYAEVLSVYPYTDVENPAAVAGDLDIAMEKVSRVVRLHNPSHWVDDCYVLLGKAQFYKQDFESAQETFEYFEEEFDPNNPNSRLYNKSKNKRKTVDEKKKKRELERELKAEKIKIARRDKAKENADKKEARKEASDTKKKFQKDIRKTKEDLRKATKDRKAQEREDRKKARKKKKKKKDTDKKDDTNTDKRSSKEIKLQGKLDKLEKEYDEFLNGKKEVVVEEKEEDIFPEEKEKEEEEKKEKAKRKKRISDSGGLFKHKPAFHEGVFWLARTYIERENYFSAEYLLRKLSDEYPTSDDIKKEIPAARAHLYLMQKEYDVAVPHLEEAIKSTGDKRLRARYAYIIGQIHQRAGREAAAKTAFENVKKHKPDYSMEFNSKLNLAKSEYKSGQADRAKVIKRLEKMLKDNKNEEFRDQVHFTIGEIKEGDGDISEAIASYQQSVATNVNNAAQKMESYFKIAQLYFGQERFVDSKNYYDSTLVAINKDDERHDHVKRYASALGEIAKNIQMIDLQDSLLALSLKPIDDQKDIVKKILEEMRKEQEVLAEAKGSDKPRVKTKVNKGFGSNESSFFAYNPTVVLAGQRTFSQKWGDRKLADNWRRSNRPGAFAEDEEDEEEVVDEGISDREIEAMLKSIPSNPPEKDRAHKKIEDALYNLGKLYREKITHNEKSVESFERLLADYPESEYRLDAYFYLYLAHTDLGQSSDAAKYANLLKNNFPDSKYTQSIVDPQFMEKYQSEQQANDMFYAETFNLFQEGSHQVVLTKVDEAFKRFETGHALLPKFALLQSMSLGSINGKDEYISSLNTLVQRYPNTPEETRAKEILRFLRGDAKAFDKSFYEEQEEAFTTDDDKLHYIIVIIYEKTEAVLQDIKIKISNYNKKYHKLDKLRISDIYLSQEEGAESQLILVRKFRNKKKAMEYYNNTQKNAADFVTQEDVGYDLFATTQKNYREIAKKKDVNAYREFFAREYLEEKK